MCPSWSSQSALLGTIHDISLDNYIQWIDANNFLTEINKVNKNIQFTIEHNENNSLVFLDSQISHENKKFDIS